MKLRTLLFASLALSGFVFASCSDDDDQKFSTASVEENKALIQDNGLAMLSEVKAMQASPSMMYTQNGINIITRYGLLRNNTQLEGKGDDLVNNMIYPLALAAELKNSDIDNFAKGDPIVAITSYLEIWSKLTGTYTWNYETFEWDYTKGDSEICIKFPSTGILYDKKDKSSDYPVNDATLRIYGLKTVAGTYTWTEATTLPTALNCELKVYNTTYLDFAFSAAYKTDDQRPSSLKFSLEMQDYKLAVEASNNDSKASASFKFKKSNETLIAMEMNVKGDWTVDNLAGDSEIGDILSSGNASIQLMNIKIAGNVDVASINKAMESYTNEVTDSVSVAAQCDIINKYAKLSVCFVDNNRIIAKVIAYPSSDTHEEWNTTTQQYDTVTEFEIGYAFKFADDSVIDSETYFSEGFDLFIYQLRYFMRN